MPKSLLPKLKKAGLSFASTDDKGQPFVSEATVPLMDGVVLRATVSDVGELSLAVESAEVVAEELRELVYYLSSIKAELSPADPFGKKPPIATFEPTSGLA